MAERKEERRGPHRGHGAPFEKPKDFKGTIKKIIRYIGGYKYLLLLVCLLAAVSMVFYVQGPKILGQATTVLFEGVMAKVAGIGGIDFAAIGSILLKVIAIYAFSELCGFLSSITMTQIVQNTTYRLRKELNEKIARMPMKYFEKNTVGDVLSRITNDVDTLGQGLDRTTNTLVYSTCSLVGTVVMMLSISPLMTGITALMLPASLVVMLVVMKKSQPHFVAQQKLLGEINGTIEETFGGLNVVQAYNREEAVLAEFDKTNEALYEAGWKSQFLSGMMMPLNSLIGNLGYVAVVISGAVLTIRGVIRIGDVQAFMSYVRNFTRPINELGQVVSMAQSMAAAAERVFAFLEEAEEESAPAQPASADHVEGSVGFHHVSFGYDEGVEVIHNWSCDVKKGETVAIVGPTGAGKTTMVKLLMRFYDVSGGEILLDGVNIRDYDRGELRRQFAMVLQDTWLFKGTIMENIRYGRADATDEEVIAAAKAAHAHRFIRSLPDGYHMELNEDATNVSQGQKQLLTIARAILADAPVLILDEATSSVDTRTEQLIQKAMDNLMEGRTCFVIAHRLSTIRNADRILVMRDGDIAEQGTHEELLERNGFYAQLWNSQFAAE